MDRTKKSILKAQGAFQDRKETLGRLAESLQMLRSLHDPESLRLGPDARWLPPSSVSINMSRQDTHVQHTYNKHARTIASSLTMSASRDEVYNELNEPISSDWMIVCSWILDRIYLAGVPAHYYLPDPSYLPEESIRFFHIDCNWIEAMERLALPIICPMMTLSAKNSKKPSHNT
jgi:hypothetical protein